MKVTPNDGGYFGHICDLFAETWLICLKKKILSAIVVAVSYAILE